MNYQTLVWSQDHHGIHPQPLKPISFGLEFLTFSGMV